MAEGNEPTTNNPDTGEGAGNVKNNEPMTVELAGLWQGATEEQRTEYGEYLKGFSKLPDFLSEHMSLKEKAESAGIVKPGEDATPEEVTAYREAMGIPEAEDGYEFDALPEGLQKDEAMEAWFKSEALKNGLGKVEANGIYKSWNEKVAQQTKEAVEASEAKAKEVEQALRKEYGNDYDTNVALAKRVMNMGGPDLWSYLDESGLGNDPRMVRMFVTYGQLISEDSLNKHTKANSGAPSKSIADRLYPEKE